MKTRTGHEITDVWRVFEPGKDGGLWVASFLEAVEMSKAWSNMFGGFCCVEGPDPKKDAARIVWFTSRPAIS